MPRLSRDDAGRVIAALHRLMELDGACADQLDIGRVLGRLSNRADLPEAARGPVRLPPDSGALRFAENGKTFDPRVVYGDGLNPTVP